MFENRLKIIKQKIIKEGIDAFLISSVSNITYLTGYSNFSKDEREAYIFLGKNFAYIITDARYSESITKEVPHLKLYERGNGKSTERLLEKHKKDVKVLGIEEDNLTVSEFKIIKEQFKEIKHFNFQRSIKEEWEIGKIENACEVGDKVFKKVLDKIKVGVTEKELAFEIEFFIKKSGADISFPTIVAFGANSSIPHHHTGKTKLEKNNFVLMDFGVKIESYCSDMTRTIFFGEPSKKQKEMYEVVLQAQNKAMNYLDKCIKKGKIVKAFEVDKIARDYIISQKYPSIPHSLGHGIGIEVHERPYISSGNKEILKIGMVFSIEPGIYIPGFGGVRIEDLFVYEKNGLKQITNSKKELIAV